MALACELCTESTVCRILNIVRAYSRISLALRILTPPAKTDSEPVPSLLACRICTQFHARTPDPLAPLEYPLHHLPLLLFRIVNFVLSSFRMNLYNSSRKKFLNPLLHSLNTPLHTQCLFLLQISLYIRPAGLLSLLLYRFKQNICDVSDRRRDPLPTTIRIPLHFQCAATTSSLTC
jgi:hypothetical protein